VERERALQAVHQDGVADAGADEAVVGPEAQPVLEPPDHPGVGEQNPQPQCGKPDFRERLQNNQIAVAGEKRLELYPDIPTISETVPGFVGYSWQGMFAPAGTPPEIVQKIAKAVAAIFQDKALRDTILKQGNLPIGNTPEEFAVFVRAERAKWKQVVTAAGLAKR
jgi:hypothetical protein